MVRPRGTLKAAYFHGLRLLLLYLVAQAAWRVGLYLLILAREAPADLVAGMAVRDPLLLLGLAAGLLGLLTRGQAAALQARLELPRRPVRDALVALVVLALPVGPAMLQGVPGPNRFGFFVTLAPGETWTISASLVPAFEVTTNSEGYRDREWRLEGEGAPRRGIVIGDSFVFGHGLGDPEDLLDRRLEAALRERTGEAWEVANLAATPSALWYYSRGVRDALEGIAPEFVVVSVLAAYDLEPYEVQRLRHGLPGPVVRALADLGIDRSAMVAGFRFGDRIGREGGEALEEARRFGVEQARLLGEAVVARGIPLILWEPMGHEPALDGLKDRPGVTFLSWRDVPEAAALMGCAPEEVEFRWKGEPRLAFPDDGHPTGMANGMIAGALARELGPRLEVAPTD